MSVKPTPIRPVLNTLNESVIIPMATVNPSLLIAADGVEQYPLLIDRDNIIDQGSCTRETTQTPTLYFTGTVV